MKHPILFYANQSIVRKLLRDAHKSNYLEETEYFMSFVQHIYWKNGLRNSIRIAKWKCVKCTEQQKGGIQHFMADLPKERFEERVFPFSNTRVDFSGPFEVKVMRKSLKRFCCLFKFLMRRAVLVENVFNLKADLCLAAITRFIGRIGET